MSTPTGTVPPSTDPPDRAPAAEPLDSNAVELARESFRAQQNLVGGIAAGLVAALVGAAIWAGITVATEFQIGWMAVGVGFLVGWTVRVVGKGVDPIFGVAGALLALVGCLAGNLLSISWFAAQAEAIPFTEVLGMLPTVGLDLLLDTFHPLDLLFYGIAIWEGFRLSFRELTPEDLKGAVQGSGAAA